jgi:hypothetical protein
LPPDQTTDIILPLSRVRKTAKMDADVRAINHDGVAMIAKVSITTVMQSQLYAASYVVVSVSSVQSQARLLCLDVSLGAKLSFMSC